MKVYYIILDKSNKIVDEKHTEEEAKSYVESMPYLRYEKFELVENNTRCDLDDIFK